ncbi:MAG TPA: flagellar biosynthesis protein FlgM [Treponema sp.]|nr:flagellar biosynthesis protein FlgM [Treponema sp.]
MMIDKIGGINPLNNVQNTHRVNGADSVNAGADSINVSDEAKEMATVYYMKQVAAETPDVRADRVAEIKEKIKDPSYLNDAVINSAADRIMAGFGL